VGGKEEEMSRHPYTYASDYIRHFAGYNSDGTILSRSEASKILEGVASVIGMTHEELATKLSLHFQAHEDEYAAQDVQDFLQNMSSR
jgi:hypothetical protein